MIEEPVRSKIQKGPRLLVANTVEIVAAIQKAKNQALRLL
jgi:hypothetical protein